MRKYIETQVQQSNFLDKVDIKEVLKDAKIGWIVKALIVQYWPKIKPILARALGPVLVDFIERLVNERI